MKVLPHFYYKHGTCASLQSSSKYNVHDGYNWKKKKNEGLNTKGSLKRPCHNYNLLDNNMMVHAIVSGSQVELIKCTNKNQRYNK